MVEFVLILYQFEVHVSTIHAKNAMEIDVIFQVIIKSAREGVSQFWDRLFKIGAAKLIEFFAEIPTSNFWVSPADNYSERLEYGTETINNYTSDFNGLSLCFECPCQIVYRLLLLRSKSPCGVPLY